MKNNIEVTSSNCWKTIGINGDGTCPELKIYIHCKKCPVYFAAGKHLFDRKIPDKYRERWSKLYSKKKETENTDTVFVIVFKLKSEWFAITPTFIQEFTENHPVHSVPFRSDKTFMGLVNINGELIPCISMLSILNISSNTEKEPAAQSLIPMMVVNNKGERYAFSADEILGVRRISREDLKNPPSTVLKTENSHTAKVFNLDDKTVGLLDDEKLIESFKRSIRY